MSNFNSIGFKGSTKEEISELVNQIIKNGEEINFKNGGYKILTDGNGAELYLQANKKGVVGLNPYFRGKSLTTVSITNEVDRVKESLDGAYHIWINPTDDLKSGEYPTVIDIPDFHTNRINKFPVKAILRIAGFPFPGVKKYENKEEFEESQKNEAKYAPNSFISQGLFASMENPNNYIEAVGLIGAEVLESETLTNKFTNQKYYHVFGKTSGTNMDFVFSFDYFETPPKNGNVLWGSFWLCGTIEEIEIVKAKSFFSRLLGK